MKKIGSYYREIYDVHVSECSSILLKLNTPKPLVLDDQILKFIHRGSPCHIYLPLQIFLPDNPFAFCLPVVVQPQSIESVLVILPFVDLFGQFHCTLDTANWSFECRYQPAKYLSAMHVFQSRLVANYGRMVIIEEVLDGCSEVLRVERVGDELLVL